jgi:hypothetical protein
MSLGVLLFMWLPALYAFPFGFTLKAQNLALLTLAVVTAVLHVFLSRADSPRKKTDENIIDLSFDPATNLFRAAPPNETKRLIRCMLITVLPMVLLTAYLHYTHNIRLAADGSMHVGQSTYGDLPLHLSIATSLRNAPFPPDYSLLPGTQLSYPFLMDTLSTSLLLYGMNLSWAMVVPSVIMTALVYVGIFLLAYRILGSLKLSALSFYLLLFCGGFGFLYSWDLLLKEPARFLEIFTGFYKAPANLTPNNIRWSNLIADMWVPQRTFLAGWCMAIPALVSALEIKGGRNIRECIALALFAGGLPLVHTHSFLALGLFCAGYFIYIICQTDKRNRVQLILTISITLAAILALAMPQLLAFTFRQSSADGFVRPHFNWVNNSGTGLYDTYLYFWLKNVGAPLLLIIPALFNLKKEMRPIAVGAFGIFAVAELVVFQPNLYDNNKLFYVWYLMIIPVAVRFGASVWRKLHGVRGRSVIAAAFIAASMFSGVLSVAREAVSDYQLFPSDEVKTAQYVEENLPSDAVFMTATNHNNAIAALAGRTIVCGTPSYLYFHGLSYQRQEQDVRSFYLDPTKTDILTRYNVSYILYGPHERSVSGEVGGILDDMYPLIYENGNYRIYKYR